MTAYTKAELKQINELRKEEQAQTDRENAVRDAAGVGYAESETVYVIYYQRRGATSWIGTSPFYDPLSTESGETHDRAEALRVAELILVGQWSPTKQGDPVRDVGRVQIIERIASMEIVAELNAPGVDGVSRGTSEPTT